jgi:hypothetical protein
MNYHTISKFFEKILKIDESLVKPQKGKEKKKKVRGGGGGGVFFWGRGRKIPIIKKINSPARHYTCQDVSSSAVYFYR